MSAAASASRASSIRKNPFCPGRRASSIVRCAGWPTATRASTATCRRATTPPMPSLRSTRTAISSRFASAPSPMSAPMSRPSALRSRARSIRRCWPACIRRRPSPSNAPASSPTPCRPMPIAAPDVRKPATCWSGWPIARRKRLASTAPKSGAAISFRPRRCPIRLRSGRHTIAAISRACLRACCRQAMSTASPRAAKLAKARGLLRGIGFACFVESSGVAPSRFAGNAGRAGRLLRIRRDLDGAGRLGARALRHA